MGAPILYQLVGFVPILPGSKIARGGRVSRTHNTKVRPTNATVRVQQVKLGKGNPENLRDGLEYGGFPKMDGLL